MKVPHTESC